MDGKGNSFSNGPHASGNSAYNGNGPVQIQHGEFCACIYCLQGHK